MRVDMSSGARARRRAQHEALLRAQLQDRTSRRELALVAVIVVACLAVTAWVLGRAWGLW